MFQHAARKRRPLRQRRHRPHHTFENATVSEAADFRDRAPERAKRWRVRALCRWAMIDLTERICWIKRDTKLDGAHAWRRLIPRLARVNAVGRSYASCTRTKCLGCRVKEALERCMRVVCTTHAFCFRELGCRHFVKALEKEITWCKEHGTKMVAAVIKQVERQLCFLPQERDTLCWPIGQ